MNTEASSVETSNTRNFPSLANFLSRSLWYAVELSFRWTMDGCSRCYRKQVRTLLYHLGLTIAYQLSKKSSKFLHCVLHEQASKIPCASKHTEHRSAWQKIINTAVLRAHFRFPIPLQHSVRKATFQNSPNSQEPFSVMCTISTVTILLATVATAFIPAPVSQRDGDITFPKANEYKDTNW